MSNRKGDRTERELVHELEDREWAVVRVPASGGGTASDRPDILAGRRGLTIAFEAKASAKDRNIYLDYAEVGALIRFASQFGAVPIVAARFDYHKWRFYHPTDLPTTEKSFVVRRPSKADTGVSDMPPYIFLDELAGLPERPEVSA